MRIDMHAETSFAALYRALDRALSLTDGRPDLRARVLSQLARIKARDDAAAALEAARAAVETAGEAPGPKCGALRALALTLPPGHPERLAALNEALRLAREARDPLAEAGALGNLGMLYRQSGRPVDALEAARRSVAQFEAAGAVWQAARSRIYLAGAAGFMQDLALVQDCALRAMEVLEPRHDAVLYGQCLGMLALVALRGATTTPSRCCSRWRRSAAPRGS
ncbi:MAG: hypothetical protein R3F59_05830 [Myxococcota bacterium]